MSAPVERTNWRDILGNPYLQPPNPDMLSDGFIKSGYRGKRGGSKRDTDEKLFIFYDRDYVINFIMKKIIMPLGVHTNETKYNDFQKLISEAIKRAKEQN